MSFNQEKNRPFRFGFLLMPQYSMIAFSCAIEPLRMANRLSEKQLYEWPIITMDGKTVPASNGLIVNPNHAIDNMPELDILFVCSGLDVSNAYSKSLQKSLYRLSRQQVKLGGLCTGTYLLARSRLLDGYRCTIHWENLNSMREAFPQVQLSDELYEIDRDRYTCAGGNASMDMMLHLITQTHGAKLSANISEQFMCDRIRSHHDRQRTPLQHYLGTSQPKLTEAVTLMEANIEEPMSLDELSHYVGVSRRQLERLFQKYLSCVPTRYYMDLRLNRARQLLLQTDKSIVDVALACGFVSAPHFTKCYREVFGIPPRDERHQHLLQKTKSD
ncbi:MAG: GlxA family transcriptional regulator [Gammaproteobacteria bacterium]|nr:GlxA family transcriptional regulator [Gammaproteobacteria bacterium]